MVHVRTRQAHLPRSGFGLRYNGKQKSRFYPMLSTRLEHPSLGTWEGANIKAACTQLLFFVSIWNRLLHGKPNKTTCSALHMLSPVANEFLFQQELIALSCCLQAVVKPVLTSVYIQVFGETHVDLKRGGRWYASPEYVGFTFVF